MKMFLSVVFLVFLALGTAVPTTPTLRAGDQELLEKQQHVIALLENIVGDLPNEHLAQIGMTYEFEPNLQRYENPSVVKYYVGLVLSGHVQPKGTPLSVSVSVLRKEVALLTQVLLGAKDYQTFLNTAAWARVHVNQDQFVKAFASAILQRHDMHGVILPPVYEVYPHYFFDTRIIQKVQDYMLQLGLEGLDKEHGEHSVHHIYVNYTSTLPHGENQIAYLTEDIGLSAYYAYIHLASYMLPQEQIIAQKYGIGGEESQHKIGHGSYYYYLHQQLLARYNLERLGQGLGPIKELDDYYEHIETPYNPHLRYINGVNFPGRDQHIYITPRHHNYELVKLVRVLEKRIIDAIDSGHVITPQGVFLSLYQPQGLNILGELIEGTGRSINPRYYGSFQAVAKNLLGNVPEFNNIWEYTPSTLELGQTALRDPIFYQLFSKILELFHYYQEALPAYQYNDIFVPGVHIEKVDVSDLVTYFKDYVVDLSNAVPQPTGQHHEHQPYPTVKAHLQRLDHKPYEFTIHVQAEKVVPGAVVRVYIGPKYNYEGQPIDINEHRHYFFEIDQFVYDLVEGHNAIVRNSHQATGQSYDWPSIREIKNHVEGAMRSQNPYYIVEPQQLFGFPARLTLPKGTQSGVPLQLFVVITAGLQHQPEHYGPVVEEEWMTYQAQHYQIVGVEEYEQYTTQPINTIHGGYQTIEVVPEFEGQLVTEGNWHWGYLYKKYPGSYHYPHWQQTYYKNVAGGLVGGTIGGSIGGSVGGSVLHHHSHHSGIQGHYNPESLQEQNLEIQNSGIHGMGQGLSYGQGQTLQHIGQQGLGDKLQQTVYNQGLHGMHGQKVVYHGSGHFPGASEYHGTYPSGIFQGWKGHEQYLQNYYQNKYIGDIVGGAVSLDNKPLGYPLDRQLAHSAFYAPNIHVMDIVVYHQDDYIPEI